MWKQLKFLSVSAILLFTCWFAITVMQKSAPVHAESFDNGVIITIKSSPDAKYSSSLEIQDRRLLRSFVKSKAVPTNRLPEIPYAYLTIKHGSTQVEYLVDYSLGVFGKNSMTQLQIPAETRQELSRYIQNARNKHFGEPLPWDQVKEIFPRNGTAQVIDLETGLSFTVQRRAGSRHADVQPVTREDTRIMKEIYNGRWSWKRRAILVKVGDRTIAASMNGMPHGAGAIRGNDFPGHSCIHFEGSTTHTLRKKDPGHSMMIRKASGQLHQEILTANPQQLLNLLSTALHEQDFHIARLTLNQTHPEVVEQLIEAVKNMEEIKIVEKQSAENQKLHEMSGLVQEIEIPAKISMVSEGKKVRKEIVCVVKRDSLLSRWTIDPESILKSIISP